MQQKAEQILNGFRASERIERGARGGDAGIPIEGGERRGEVVKAGEDVDSRDRRAVFSFSSDSNTSQIDRDIPDAMPYGRGLIQEEPLKFDTVSVSHPCQGDLTD